MPDGGQHVFLAALGQAGAHRFLIRIFNRAAGQDIDAQPGQPIADGRLGRAIGRPVFAARAKGVTVVLASGRPLEGMSRYLVELGLTGE